MSAAPTFADLRNRIANGEHIRLADTTRSRTYARPARLATVTRQPTPHEAGEIRVRVGVTVSTWSVALLSRCEESGSVVYQVIDGSDTVTVSCQPNSVPACDCRRYRSQWECLHADAVCALLRAGRLE